MGLSPFDPRVSQLTRPQMAWAILNHYKDQDEFFDSNIKPLCRFVNPTLGAKVFDVVEEVVEASDDEFLREINEHTSTKFKTTDELDAVMEADSSIDTIEPV